MCCDRVIKDQPHIQWIDNFSKIYFSKVPNVQQGTFKDALWTGIANKKYTGPNDIDLAVVRDDNNNVIHGMPSHYALWENLGALYSEFKETDGEGMEYLQHSWVEKLDVDNVPLRPEVSKSRYPRLHASLLKSVSSLDHMIPEKLKKDNIGSNIGLFKVLRSILDDVEGARVKRYRVVLSDIDIYWRIMKVYEIYCFCVFPLLLSMNQNIVIQCFR